MLKNNYLRIALIAAIVVGGIWTFASKKDRLGLSLSTVVLIGVIMAGQWPPVAAAIMQRPRATVAVGATLAVLGIVGAIFTDLGVSEAGRMQAGLLMTVAGVAIAVLPRSMKADAEAKAKAMTAEPRTKPSGLQDGLEALAMPFRRVRMSVVVLGPWFALFLAAPTAAFVPLLILGDGWIKGLGRGGALAVLLAIAAAILVMYGALMAAAIQWGRFVGNGRPPPLRVPWRSLWSFAWRWIVFGSLSRVPNQFGPWLTAHYPTMTKWASISLTSLVGLAFLTLISPMGLVLPALALRARDTSISGALTGARTAGRSFYAGALVVLSPFALLSWLIDLLPTDRSDNWLAGGLGVALFVAWAVSFFVTIPAAMTFLTRAYVRGAGREPAAA